ncbi:uncharacterized protein C16orf46 homolog [Rhynchocyon petersi]
MDLCQKSETGLENHEDPSTKEPDLTSPCPDGSCERNHVCCLLNISDLTLEQDAKAESVLGTGWEEAVQGWGNISPMACIWPRKKVKKARVEGSASNCLFCASITQGIPESRPQAQPGKAEVQASAEAGSAKDQSSASQSLGFPRVPSIASREMNKPCLPHQSHSEKKSLQVKEFIWCSNDWTAPETLKGPRSHQRLGGSVDREVSMAPEALLVLPPLKASLPHGLDTLGKRTVFLEQEEKGPSEERGEGLVYPCGFKTVDRKSEPAEHPKVKDSAPFPTQAGRPALTADPECCLHWALLPEPSLLGPPSASNLPYLTTLQLLQKQGPPGHRTRLKAKEPSLLGHTQRHFPTEAKQDNRPKPLDTPVFPGPLLPSLTVSRVAIRVSAYRVL